MFRFGTASQALAEANSRLAVAEAVESERARLAREMHDSVAKTLHGLALAAEALATSPPTTDGPARRRVPAQPLVALGGPPSGGGVPRPPDGPAPPHGPDVPGRRPDRGTGPEAAEFEQSTRNSRPALDMLWTDVGHGAPHGSSSFRTETAHHLLAIVSEALENTHRHANATTGWT